MCAPPWVVHACSLRPLPPLPAIAVRLLLLGGLPACWWAAGGEVW